MKIALLGATRGTGRCVLEQALARGHEVRGLARDPSTLPAHERLTVVTGDARNVADVAKTIAGVDVVLSCIGSSQLKRAERLVSASASATIEAMKRERVKRLLLVSVQGIGDSATAVMKYLVGPVFRLVVPAAYDTILEDKARAEELIRVASAGGDLEWTFVRGPRLTDAPPKGRYRAMPSAQGKNPMAKISRADLATFMLTEAAARQWVNAAVLVCD